MNMLRELSDDECRALISSGVVGRVAMCTPSGPQIVPVNYSVWNDSIVFRTSPYSTLGMQTWPAQLAFEVDHIDTEHGSGWSVVATGSARRVEDSQTLSAIRREADPRPWAEGSRLLYIRLAWTSLTGRQIGVSGKP